MGRDAPITFRTPLILLALADLAALGMRLWPWQEITNLPGQGTTGYDPAICLALYVILLLWIAGSRSIGARKALSVGTIFGLLAGILLAVHATLEERASQSAANTSYLMIGLLVAAAVLWGIAGLRGARVGGSAGLSLVTGIWSAMVSSLIGCAAVLAEIDLNNPHPISLNPWKQYEALAIGNQAAQDLVHSLNTATAYLLIGPLVGCTAGLLFALFAGSGNAPAKPKKSK
jgi:NAD/NADP transhydrogenase beta subunit